MIRSLLAQSFRQRVVQARSPHQRDAGSHRQQGEREHHRQRRHPVAEWNRSQQIEDGEQRQDREERNAALGAETHAGAECSQASFGRSIGDDIAVEAVEHGGENRRDPCQVTQAEHEGGPEEDRAHELRGELPPAAPRRGKVDRLDASRVQGIGEPRQRNRSGEHQSEKIEDDRLKRLAVVDRHLRPEAEDAEDSNGDCASSRERDDVLDIPRDPGTEHCRDPERKLFAHAHSPTGRSRGTHGDTATARRSSRLTRVPAVPIDRTAADAQASPSASASEPWPPAAMKPARSASPAPTVLRTSVTEMVP